MSRSRLPATPFTRCALALTLFVCLLFLVGMLWVVKEFHQQNLFPWPVAAVATQVAAAQVADSPLLPVAQDSPSSPKSKSALVDTQIEKMVARSQQQSADQNLSELDKMTKTLDSVSSDASVDELANSVQRWMGLPSRTSPSQAVTKIDKFDINSAQLDDVRRRTGSAGKGYTAVLIDAHGNTLDIELTEAEGAETFALMERIKSSPLLEKIYRRIAMPLLDNLVQAARERKDE